MSNKKVRQAIFTILFHIAGIIWIIAGIMTATTLN